MDFLFLNARILLPEVIADRAMYVRDEEIDAVGEHLDAQDSALHIDARGKRFLPPGVDIHLHGGGRSGQHGLDTGGRPHARSSPCVLLRNDRPAHPWAASLTGQYSAFACVRQTRQMLALPRPPESIRRDRSFRRCNRRAAARKPSSHPRGPTGGRFRTIAT